MTPAPVAAAEPFALWSPEFWLLVIAVGTPTVLVLRRVLSRIPVRRPDRPRILWEPTDNPITVAKRIAIALLSLAAAGTGVLWAASSARGWSACQTGGIAPDRALSVWLSPVGWSTRGPWTVGGWLWRFDPGAEHRAYIHIWLGDLRFGWFQSYFDPDLVPEYGRPWGTRRVEPRPKDVFGFRADRFTTEQGWWPAISEQPRSRRFRSPTSALPRAEWKLIRTAYASVTSLEVPLWALLVLFISWPLVAFIRGPVQRVRSWKPSNVCLRCGYDLTGNTSGICPECGRPIDEGATA